MSYDGSSLLGKQQILTEAPDGRLRPVGKNNPIYVKFEDESEPPAPSAPVSILGAGSAAGSAFYPASGAVSKETDITVFYGATNTAQSTFSSFVVDINGRQSVLPGIRQNVSIAQVNTAAVGDIVGYTIPVGCRLKIEYTAPTGSGTLNIKGVV